MSVKTRKHANSTNRIENGTAILMDLDKKTYIKRPAPKQKIAVLVPDWNIPQITKILIAARKILSQVNLPVIAIIIKTTDDAAALMP
jgi:hypothetical protein